MGIGIEVHNFEKEVIESLGAEWEDIKMCELGNQKVKFQYPRIPAKKYYEGLGVQEHVSIDLNAQDGALPIDLDFPLPDYLVNRFHIVTNYGTLEHVNNQYQGFKNVHDLCKVEGVMIHSFPPIGHWEGHGRYYYNEEFVEHLAGLCDYEIINTVTRITRKKKSGRDLVLAALKKKKTDFISDKTFLQLKYQDTQNLTKTGDYSKRKKTIFNRIFKK